MKKSTMDILPHIENRVKALDGRIAKLEHQKKDLLRRKRYIMKRRGLYCGD